MLILGRKVGESIIIGEGIEINILDITEGSVKIGINAPKNIKIIRKEIIGEVVAQNKDSIESAGRLLDLIKHDDKHK